MTVDEKEDAHQMRIIVKGLGAPQKQLPPRFPLLEGRAGVRMQTPEVRFHILSVVRDGEMLRSVFHDDTAR